MSVSADNTPAALVTFSRETRMPAKEADARSSCTADDRTAKAQLPNRAKAPLSSEESSDSMPSHVTQKPGGMGNPACHIRERLWPFDPMSSMDDFSSKPTITNALPRIRDHHPRGFALHQEFEMSPDPYRQRLEFRIRVQRSRNGSGRPPDR